MRRVHRIPAALLVVAASAGCGAEKPEGVPTWSPPAAPITPVTAPVATPSSTAEKTTFEQAMARYVAENYPRGTRYVGDCENAKPDPRAVCGLRKATVDGGEVWAIGVPYSEVDGFLLLSRGDAGWRVVEAYARSSGGEPEPVPSWFAGIG